MKKDLQPMIFWDEQRGSLNQNTEAENYMPELMNGIKVLLQTDRGVLKMLE